MDVNACKQELDGIRQAVEYKGWTITPDWRIDMGNNAVGRDPIKAAALQKLQGDLNACKVHAHNTDHELATAIGVPPSAKCRWMPWGPPNGESCWTYRIHA